MRMNHGGSRWILPWYIVLLCVGAAQVGPTARLRRDTRGELRGEEHNLVEELVVAPSSAPPKRAWGAITQDTWEEIQESLSVRAAAVPEVSLSQHRVVMMVPPPQSTPSKKHKSQPTALLLQIFLGWIGAAYAYLQRWELLSVAVVLFVLTFCICGCAVYRFAPKVSGGRKEGAATVSPNDDGQWCLEIFMPMACCCLLSSGIMVFHIWGIVVIASGTLADGNGVLPQ